MPTSLEAEPMAAKEEEKPKDGANASGEKKEKKPEGDKKSDAEKKPIVPEAAPSRQPRMREQSQKTITRMIYDSVRKPMYNVLLATAFVTNPVAGITLYGADKALSNIPVVEKLYNPIKNNAIKVATAVGDTVIGAAAAVPGVPLQFVRDVGEAVTNTEVHQAKTLVGKGAEALAHGVGDGLEMGKKALIWTAEQGVNLLKGGADILTKLLGVCHGLSKSAAHKIVGGGGALENITSLATTGAILYGIAYATGYGPAANAILGSSWGWIKTLAGY